MRTDPSPRSPRYIIDEPDVADYDRGSTREDELSTEDVDGSVEMADFKMFGSPTPTSNGVSDVISKFDQTEPERYLVE